MNQAQFDRQIQRLASNFGKTAYSSERVLLLWKDLKELSEPWLERVIDQFIGSSRQAPLLPDFREEIAKERERLWRIEKDQYEKEAKEFFSGSYAPDDVRTLCQYILKRFSGGVSDSDYANFIEHLTYTAKSAPHHKQSACSQCEDDGLIFQSDQDHCKFVFRCTCIAGRKKPKAYPIWEGNT